MLNNNDQKKTLKDHLRSIKDDAKRRQEWKRLVAEDPLKFRIVHKRLGDDIFYSSLEQSFWKSRDYMFSNQKELDEWPQS